MQISTDYIHKTLADIVRIDSVNPELSPDGAGETELADYIANELKSFGLDVEMQEPTPGRKNTIGIMRGSGGGRSLMLNAHTDTVGIDGMEDPFSGEIKDGKLYGRGAYDMKGSIAVTLAVLKAFIEQGIRPKGDVLFTAVIDEEAASAGTAAIIKDYTADAAIVTEPTALQVCCGARGFQELEITVQGRAAHGSHYREGIDATMMMGRVLGEMEKLANKLVNQDGHPLLGPATLHVPLISGGSSRFIYASECKAHIEWRTIPELDDQAGVMAEIQAILDGLKADDPKFNATLRPVFGQKSYATDVNSDIAQTVLQAVRDVRKSEPEIYGAPWWMDSALLAEAGIETIVIGPDGDGAHAAVEWVDLDSLESLAYILGKTILNF